jgi:hypothetical protein
VDSGLLSPGKPERALDAGFGDSDVPDRSRVNAQQPASVVALVIRYEAAFGAATGFQREVLRLDNQPRRPVTEDLRSNGERGRPHADGSVHSFAGQRAFTPLADVVAGGPGRRRSVDDDRSSGHRAEARHVRADVRLIVHASESARRSRW